jgi:hypothetical protein
VELPVTLVQDHTLFEILRERSIERWSHKGDWIIRNHGLINVIVHPDYIRSPERLALYDAFLSWLRSRIECSAGWHALPRDVAAWWRTRAALCEQLDDDALAKVGASLPGDATVAHVTERDGDIVFEL